MAVKPAPSGPKEPKQARPAKSSKHGSVRRNHRLPHDLWGLAIIAAGGILLISLIISPDAGRIGNSYATLARLTVGVGAYVLPFIMFIVAGRLISGPGTEYSTHRILPIVLLMYLSLVGWHVHLTAHVITEGRPFPHTDTWADIGKAGGVLGALSVMGLRAGFSDLTSYFLLGILGFMAVIWAIDVQLIHVYKGFVRQGIRVGAPVLRGAQMAREGAERLSQRRAREYTEDVADGAFSPSRSKLQRSFLDGPTKELAVQPPNKLRTPDTSVAAVAPPAPATSHKAGSPIFERFTSTESSNMTLPFSADPASRKSLGSDSEKDTLHAQQGPPSALVVPDALGLDGTGKAFQLPPLSLLKESPPPPERQDALAKEKQAILMQTLNDFKIGANVAQVAMGPTVTRYEVQLEPGILVKKIVSLADNLAMSLAAIDVRVEAPIPGKSAIGIEVPNDVCQLVSLRECLSTTQFMTAASKLTFALGKDVSGEFKYADLARMPHLLVGGSTNSGKSVCLNVIISSILYRATPREVKFVMIDPKRVELSLYDGIPHLLAPVIKDVKQAAGIFRSVLKEMEDRYDRFARIGTRNIEGYNNRVEPKERLPFIVLVVDELADLMMQQGPEVETSICRLAQLARATGIHLVIATQRPSVDVITGTIKANISSRIAFAVATQVDSRTIIDMPGADRLIGRGDMLFMPIDAAKPVRIQGCFVGERETDELVSYLKDQEEAVYTMTPSETSASGMGGFDDDDGSTDELFEPCVRWLVMQGQCSTSSLQRKFKIGYTRAARLVETMEAMQIVGSQDGVKPREVMLRPENLEVFFLGRGQGDLGQI